MDEAKLLIKYFPFMLYIKEKMYVQYAQTPFPSFLYTEKDKRKMGIGRTTPNLHRADPAGNSISQEFVGFTCRCCGFTSIFIYLKENFLHDSGDIDFR